MILWAIEQRVETLEAAMALNDGTNSFVAASYDNKAHNFSTSTRRCRDITPWCGLGWRIPQAQ